MSSVLKKVPTQERLNQARQLAAAIFGHPWNPECKRLGTNILRAELKGPELVKYYGVNEDIPTFKDFKKWFPELKLVDPRETYRLHMIQDRKKRNKGAPKKKKA
ncbi:mitochondrial ribosome small subunit component [Scheffersomyces amazonensis]|uniref:mitochondrial ribosome small subunit component n=1 Tax=Scheffersomyces amazonensis TaxID=1078765 RepID=UPI00315D018F